MTVFPGRRRRSVLSLGLAVVLTVSLAVTGGGFWIALAATVLVVSAVAVFLPRLRADGNGIGVASLGGSFRVPWAEIDGFGLRLVAVAVVRSDQAARRLIGAGTDAVQRRQERLLLR
jgi:hypothetical protein